jgi:hypothetical protein
VFTGPESLGHEATEARDHGRRCSYELRYSVFDSFGETAFRVTVQSDETAQVTCSEDDRYRLAHGLDSFGGWKPPNTRNPSPELHLPS